MIRLAQTRSLALPDRLGLILRLAERVQPLLDAAHYGPIPALCHEFEALSPRQLALVRRRMRPRAPFFPCWMVLRNMEHLTTRFPWLLDRANHAEPPDSFDTRFPLQAENLLVYFLFRYVLKAVNDGQLLPRAESCIFHLLSLRYLCGAAGALTPDALQPWSVSIAKRWSTPRKTFACCSVFSPATPSLPAHSIGCCFRNRDFTQNMLIFLVQKLHASPLHFPGNLLKCSVRPKIRRTLLFV